MAVLRTFVSNKKCEKLFKYLKNNGISISNFIREAVVDKAKKKFKQLKS